MSWAGLQRRSMIVKIVVLHDAEGCLLMKSNEMWDHSCPGTGKGLSNPAGCEQGVSYFVFCFQNTLPHTLQIFDQRWPPKQPLRECQSSLEPGMTGEFGCGFPMQQLRSGGKWDEKTVRSSTIWIQFISQVIQDAMGLCHGGVQD